MLPLKVRVYLPISKLHSIIVAANLLAHNNISQICYCGQIPLQSAAVNCSFSGNLTTFWVTFILLAMVHQGYCFHCRIINLVIEITLMVHSQNYKLFRYISSVDVNFI